MNAPTFILGLRERGAALEIEGGRLRVTPSTALTDADRAAWRKHKREIIALLESASREAGTADPSSTRSESARVCLVGDQYDARAAFAEANRLFRLGRIDAEQRDNLCGYALRALLRSV